MKFQNTRRICFSKKRTLKSPLDSLSINPEKEKELYNIYCGICHGEKEMEKGT